MEEEEGGIDDIIAAVEPIEWVTILPTFSREKESGERNIRNKDKVLFIIIFLLGGFNWENGNWKVDQAV